MKSFRRKTHLQGMALVISLALIVLLSVAVLAFFSFTTASRRIEASRANRTKAELLAESGGTYATAQLLAEIIDSALSDIRTISDVSTYRPLNATNAFPKRLLSSTINLADATFANLIRQSIPSIDPQVSMHGSFTSTANGRSIGTTRWNTPALLTGDGFKANNQLPNWVYLDRANSITPVPKATTIGRFAYNVYNIGGLLNVNVAGYPSDLDGAQRIALRGGQGAADLVSLFTSIGLSSIDAQTARDTLMSFRFPDHPSAANYVQRLLGMATNGFLNVQSNEPDTGTSFKENMFVNRQDLIRYAHTQNSKLTPALPYLTHFSRSVNAPTCDAPTPPPSPAPAYTNPDLMKVRFTSAGPVAHYDDKGYMSSYSVKAGDPLVQRRFSLAKIAWLTPTGNASDISEEAMKSSFGLKWNPDQERWDYHGSTGSSLQSTIKTLAEVAAEATPREPNFFEMLKAGLLDGSLGSAVTTKTASGPLGVKGKSVCATGSFSFDSSKDLHVLKIGANIIDNADTDNYPTRIAFFHKDSGPLGPLQGELEQAGVEDLPYFFALDLEALADLTQRDASNVNVNMWDFVWVPELLNIHRPSSPTGGPKSIRIEIGEDAVLLKVGVSSGGFAPAVSAYMDPVKNIAATNENGITVNSDHFEDFRRKPQAVRSSDAVNRLGAMAPYVSSEFQNIQAFMIYSFEKEFGASYSHPYPGTRGFPSYQSGSSPVIALVQNAIVRLVYESPTGTMRTYATMGGNDDFAEESGINGMPDDAATDMVLRHEGNYYSLTKSFADLGIAKKICSTALHPWDPRSSRFGPVMARNERPCEDGPRFDTGNRKISISVPIPFYPFYKIYEWDTSFLGCLPSISAFPDPDTGTIPRSPDGGLGFVKAGTATKGNPYANLDSNDARPVILQRPYRSVGELGYVFRDTPWQTLNFYNGQSADALLLDLFSVTDQPKVTADRIALGTPHQPVLQALLNGAAADSDGTNTLSSAVTQTLSSTLNSYAFSSGIPQTTYPGNPADLVKFMSTLETGGATLDQIKTRREVLVRALAASQTRTWNVLIDVVAQGGRFLNDSYNANDFSVEGESRLWISVAIDRYTGEVVDQQVEQVNE